MRYCLLFLFVMSSIAGHSQQGDNQNNDSNLERLMFIDSAVRAITTSLPTVAISTKDTFLYVNNQLGTQDTVQRKIMKFSRGHFPEKIVLSTSSSGWAENINIYYIDKQPIYIMYTASIHGGSNEFELYIKDNKIFYTKKVIGTTPISPDNSYLEGLAFTLVLE